MRRFAANTGFLSKYSVVFYFVNWNHRVLMICSRSLAVGNETKACENSILRTDADIEVVHVLSFACVHNWRFEHVLAGKRTGICRTKQARFKIG